jgi:hypothetical protein
MSSAFFYGVEPKAVEPSTRLVNSSRLHGMTAIHFLANNKAYTHRSE